jgi:hypothetical protein
MRSILIAISILVVTATASSAQLTHRLKGSLQTEAGAPIANATVRAEAITGFRGEPFAGGAAGDLSVPTDAKGEWNLLGIQSGLWLFSSNAPDTIPAVIVLPVKFSQRQAVSAVGNSLTWPLPMWAMPAKGQDSLKVALDCLQQKKLEEAAQALTVALAPDTPVPTMIAAGELALLARQHNLARTLFDIVAKKDPKNARAQAGLASAALMARDWETAGKLLWIARDLVPKEQRPAYASAITDLQQIARVQ